MKNILLSITVLAFSAVLLSACTKEENFTFSAETMTTEVTETTTEFENVISGEDALASPGAVDIHKKLDTTNLTPDQIADIFYYNSCFIGDSLMQGFGYYTAYPEAPEFMNNIYFLAATNFSTYHALSPLEDENAIHPVFRGQKMTVFDGVAQLKPKRIFIELGMNELAGNGAVDRLLNNLSAMIYRFRQIVPDCEFYLISATPMTKDYEKPGYDNTLIHNYNKELAASVGAWDAHYVDLASILTAPDGCLPNSYSSDGYLHMTNESYSYWADYFRKYAVEHINEDFETVTETSTGTAAEATTESATGTAAETTTEAATATAAKTTTKAATTVN